MACNLRKNVSEFLYPVFEEAVLSEVDGKVHPPLRGMRERYVGVISPELRAKIRGRPLCAMNHDRLINLIPIRGSA